MQSTLPVTRGDADVKLGTDFAGMDTPLLALKNMGFTVRHVFTSEKNMSCNKLSATISPNCELRYKDVKDRNTLEVPLSDIYVAGVPCTPWCQGGTQSGLESDAGKLWAHTLNYIIKRQPKSFVLECAPTLRTQKKFDNVKKDILQVLTQNGYEIHDSLIRTDQHGLPQTRSRWYVVGVKLTAKRRAFTFPTPLNGTIPLERIIPGDKVGDGAGGGPRLTRKAQGHTKKLCVRWKYQFATSVLDVCSQELHGALDFLISPGPHPLVHLGR